MATAAPRGQTTPGKFLRNPVLKHSEPSLLLFSACFRQQHTLRASLKHWHRAEETPPCIKLLPAARLKFQGCSRERSPLSSWELLGSIQVQLSDFFGCLNDTVGVLYVYQPLHSFALLLRVKNKREVKELSHPALGCTKSSPNTLQSTPKAQVKILLPASKTIYEPRHLQPF